MLNNNNLLLKRQACPVCKSQKLKDIYSSSYKFTPIHNYISNAYGKNCDTSQIQENIYSLLQCQKCDLIFQEYIPSPELMNQLYETSCSPHFYSGHNISYYTIYTQDIIQLLSFLGKAPTKVKILDFGMGWGRWALMAKAFGCDVYGTELSLQRLKYAESNGIKALTWDEIPDVSFDFINTDQVVEHLAYPVEVIEYLTKSLQPDGIIKICVPNSFGIRFRLKYMDWEAPKGSIKSLNPVAPLEHINCFYRKSMLELARVVGLKEVKVPLLMQYQCSTLWNSPKKILRNLAMPIYRNVFGLQNYYLFQLLKGENN